MKNLKLLLLILVAFTGAQVAKASHIAGASIYYDPISSTQYRVTVVVFRYCGGVSLGTGPQTIRARNTCSGYNSPFTANLIPNSGLPLPDECTLNLPPTRCNGGTRYGLEKYEYQAIFTVPANTPANCPNWLFESNIPCCRNANVSTNAGTMFVDAYLNHGLQPRNSNARVKTIFLPGNCAGSPITVDLGAFDPNLSDSLRYLMVPAKQAANNPVVYIAPKTALQPIATAPGGQIVFDSITGLLTLTPTPNIQIGVFAFKIEDYRQTAPGVWELAGWYNLDIQYYFENNPVYCQNVKPSFIEKTVEKQCGDSTLQFTFNTDVTCTTINPNGSELRITSPYGQDVPVRAVIPVNCNSTGSPGIIKTRGIDVGLYHGFFANGQYKLFTKKGDDLDTYGNKCKKFMNEFDTVLITVKGCYDYNTPMDLINVTVDDRNNKDILVQWAKPDTFDFNHFNSYTLYKKKNPDNPWIPILTIKDPNVLSYRDISENPVADTAKYAISLKIKSGKTMAINDSIDNFRFWIDSTNIGEQLDMKIFWQEYIGWNTPVYQVEYTSGKDTLWQFPIPAISTKDQTTTFVKPIVAGNYLIRAFTNDPNSSLRSYSNWVPFEVPAREVKTFNLITANGDGINDNFEVDGLKYWPNTLVRIYNRWGQMVFESKNYENNWGSKADEGTYYYYVQTADGKVKNGFVRVLK